ncbi:ecdysone-inducible gene E3 [Cochliomyia hominivorax]
MNFLQTINGIFYITLVYVLNRQQVNAANLLNSYLPASMQALAYYIDHLQYEPQSSTTVEPPFNDGSEHTTTSSMNSASTTTSTTSTTTTRKPYTSSTSSWWNPPAWWIPPSTTTKKPTPKPTPPHKPALYAPDLSNLIMVPSEGYDIFYDLGNSPEGFNNLPLSLIQDIVNEIDHDEFSNDVESLDNFLRLYDDNYGRAIFDADSAMDRWSTTSTAGKKRVPPTKPYVEFLLVYDLLKRDAKSSNLSKYEGYTDELLNELHELSQMSSQRQLYTLFKRMIERGDIQRSDVVARIQGIIKDLGNPNSATVNALRYIPAMPFLP